MIEYQNGIVFDSIQRNEMIWTPPKTLLVCSYGQNNSHFASNLVEIVILPNIDKPFLE